jgi:hypothetical protein
MSEYPTAHRSVAQTMAGDGLPCAGCGAPVESDDRLYMVVLRGLTYGFHASCYQAWTGDTAGTLRPVP